MEALKRIWDGLIEKLKASLQEQQEREWYIRLRERYDSLPGRYQKLLQLAGLFFALIALLWVPLTTLEEAYDLNTAFEERRGALKDLLKIEREYSSVPFVPSPPPPIAMKAQFDQRLAVVGVKPEQLKEFMETQERGTANADRKGAAVLLNHVTIKQALDLAYEFEQSDKSLRLADFELTAEKQDPHFYTLRLKLINFIPKAGRG